MRFPSGLVGALSVIVAGAAVVCPNADASGISGRIPLLRQLTHITTGVNGPPKLRLEQGSSVALVSNADLLGPGSDTPQTEVYLIDTATGDIRRLSNGSGGSSYEAVRETDATASIFSPYVTFTSTEDLDPSVGNPEHNPEIFVATTATGEIHQITNTGAGIVNSQPYSSDGGECLVFRSNGDLDTNHDGDALNPDPGYSNPDGSDEIFLIRFDDPTFKQRQVTQVSNGPAGTTSYDPVIGGYWFTRQCRTTAYVSDYDQLGNGSVGDHIYEFTKINGLTAQISKPGASENLHPAISGASNFARGPFVVFDSDADMLGNGPTGAEIYRERMFKFELIQYTSQLTGESHHPVISDGGGMMAFDSTAELLSPVGHLVGDNSPPFNADGNSEIFRTKDTRQIWQLTRTKDCENTFPSIQNDGFGIAFLSTCDLIPGQNPNHLPQIFLYRDTKPNDPQQFNCQTAQSCCNEANHCYLQRISYQKPLTYSRLSKSTWQ